jgi:serine/threonine protein kinase
VTIHELLFGCRPFDPSLLRSGLAQPSSGQHLPSLFRDQHISSSCKNFVQELLKFDPALRLGAKGGHDEILAHEWLHTYPHKAAVLKRKLVPSYLPAVSDFASQHLSNSSIREAVEKMNSSAEVPYEEFVGYEFNCSLRGRSSKDPLSPISPSLATVLLPDRRSGHSTPVIVVEKTHSFTSNDKETSGGVVPAALRSISSCVFDTPLADSHK